MFADIYHSMTSLHVCVIATKHGRRACAGWANYVVDLDLDVARTGRSPRGRRRQGGWRSRGTRGRGAHPRRNRDKSQFLRRAVWVKTLSVRLRKDIYSGLYLWVYSLMHFAIFVIGCLIKITQHDQAIK